MVEGHHFLASGIGGFNLGLTGAWKGKIKGDYHRYQ